MQQYQSEFFPDLWRRRLKTDLPPPLPLSSSPPQCSAGQPLGLREVMQARGRTQENVTKEM